MDGWAELRGRGRDGVTVGGHLLSRGSRVRLMPRAGGDVFDIALAGREAVVHAVEEDTDGNVQLAVIVEDDPGADLGAARQIGHRFFFAPDEVEPIADPPTAPHPEVRVLVAGIGNVFMGDDGFGVELARALMDRPLPAGVEVKDFGIRGMDLMYALGEGWDAALLLDATPRGGEPGTVYVIEPRTDPDALSLDTHGMDPVRVLRLASELGPVPARILVVGCEPAVRMTGEEDDVLVELSEPVRHALDGAVGVVERLLGEIVQPDEKEVRR